MEQRGQNMEDREPEMGLPQPPLEITGGVQEIPETQWVLDPVEGSGGVAEFLAMLGFENPVLVSEDGQVLEIPIGELNRAGFGTREDIGSLLYKEPDWEGFFYVQNRQDILQQQQQQQLELLPQQQSLQLHMADQSFQPDVSNISVATPRLIRELFPSNPPPMYDPEWDQEWDFFYAHAQTPEQQQLVLKRFREHTPLTRESPRKYLQLDESGVSERKAVTGWGDMFPEFSLPDIINAGGLPMGHAHREQNLAE